MIIAKDLLVLWKHTASLSVSCGAWIGKKFSVDLKTSDFKDFLEGMWRLNDSLKGEASFFAIEDKLKFKMTGNGLGKIEVKGQALSSYVPHCALQFNFEIDQTYLGNIVKQLQQITSAFPVR
jgi:hypothetical protein